MLYDTTPDKSHREQLTRIIRYVDIDYKNCVVEIKESFLGFVEVHGKTAKDLTDLIIDSLTEDGIDLDDCRSQCYDNAAVMAGDFTGVKERILLRNQKARFINCDNHSLNLAAMNSAKQEVKFATIFATIQSIYKYHATSTIRWNKLKERAMPKGLPKR